MGPVNKRDSKIEGIPISTVSFFASPMDKPRGIKSQPTCSSIAKNAGNAKNTGKARVAIPKTN